MLLALADGAPSFRSVCTWIERKFGELLESMSDGIILTDASRNIVLAIPRRKNCSDMYEVFLVSYDSAPYDGDQDFQAVLVADSPSVITAGHE